MYLVDSHCHLDRLNYQSLHKNIDDVFDKAFKRGVKFYLTVATTLNGYQTLRELIGEKDNVAFSCGIHPLNLEESHDIEELEALSKNPDVVAIGETGLDYHYGSKTSLEQKKLFREHIRIARTLNKPVIIHARQAKNDIIKILKEEQARDCSGVLHCFSEDKETASQLLDLGFYISFSGIITFRNAINLQDIARYVPLDHILLETDSPYLAPVPHRGKENQPAMLRDVAEHIAALKKISVSELAVATTENFANLFQIDRTRLKIH